VGRPAEPAQLTGAPVRWRLGGRCAAAGTRTMAFATKRRRPPWSVLRRPRTYGPQRSQGI